MVSRFAVVISRPMDRSARHSGKHAHSTRCTQYARRLAVGALYGLPSPPQSHMTMSRERMAGDGVPRRTGVIDGSYTMQGNANAV